VASHLVEGPAGRIGKVPIDVALARYVRALVAATHGDDHVGLLGEVSGQQPRPALAQVHADLAHRFEHLRMNVLRRRGPGRGGGVPAAVADLKEGEIVLDLGSDAGAENVSFVKGYIESMPLADEAVDVVISNCVINLSADKPRVIREAARVLRPGGRFAVSDVIADEGIDEATRTDMAAWTGCIAGALTRREFETAFEQAGFAEIAIQPTHRVHEHAASVVIRARKPGP
jgi:SAM-dependent methyltransferase